MFNNPNPLTIPLKLIYIFFYYLESYVLCRRRARRKRCCSGINHSDGVAAIPHTKQCQVAAEECHKQVNQRIGHIKWNAVADKGKHNNHGDVDFTLNMAIGPSLNLYQSIDLFVSLFERIIVFVAIKCKMS